MKQKIIDAFMFRHACKEFDVNKKITKEDFDFILETARLSPSSFGFEPWEFHIIQDMQLREKLLKYCWGAGKQFPTASHVIMTLVKKSCFMKYDSEYITHIMKDIKDIPEEGRKMRGEFYKKFQEVDFKLSESERAMNDWAGKQAYIPLANMMTAAAMVGIDSCPIEGFDKEKTESIITQEMKIDTDKYALAYFVCFGYRKEEPREKTRQKIEDITVWW